MATSTRSNGRAPRTPARGSSSKTAPTKKLPASSARASAPAKAKSATPDRPPLLVRAWMGLAHVTGGPARALGPETLAERGAPRRASRSSSWCSRSPARSSSGSSSTTPSPRRSTRGRSADSFGRVAFALPVVMLLFAVWLFRHPSSVHDNTRIGIGARTAAPHGLGLLPPLRRPARAERGHGRAGAAGGILGWMLAQPLILLITEVGARPSSSCCCCSRC